MRAVEDPRKGIFGHNQMWQTVLSHLDNLSENSKPLLEGTEIVPGISLRKDEVYDELFRKPDNNDVIDLTGEFLKLLCSGFVVLLARQLKDQLVGGKYHQ